MAVVRKMPSRVYGVVPHQVDRVSASSIRYDQRRNASTQAIGDAVEGSDFVANIPEINVIGAGQARYRSRETRGVSKDQSASRIRPEGDVGGRLGTQFERCGAADHRAPGARDRAVNRNVSAIRPDQSRIYNIAIQDQAAAAGRLKRSGVGYDIRSGVDH